MSYRLVWWTQYVSGKAPLKTVRNVCPPVLSPLYSSLSTRLNTADKKREKKHAQYYPLSLLPSISYSHHSADMLRSVCRLWRELRHWFKHWLNEVMYVLLVRCCFYPLNGISTENIEEAFRSYTWKESSNNLVLYLKKIRGWARDRFKTGEWYILMFTPFPGSTLKHTRYYFPHNATLF